MHLSRSGYLQAYEAVGDADTIAGKVPGLLAVIVEVCSNAQPMSNKVVPLA